MAWNWDIQHIGAISGIPGTEPFAVQTLFPGKPGGEPEGQGSYEQEAEERAWKSLADELAQGEPGTSPLDAERFRLAQDEANRQAIRQTERISDAMARRGMGVSGLRYQALSRAGEERARALENRFAQMGLGIEDEREAWQKRKMSDALKFLRLQQPKAYTGSTSGVLGELMQLGGAIGGYQMGKRGPSQKSDIDDQYQISEGGGDIGFGYQGSEPGAFGY